MLLWAAADELAEPAKSAVAESAAVVFVSAASVWEIEIKRALGRLQAPDDVAELVDGSGLERLPISFEHAHEAGGLPPHHADPFDRMLIAQARVEGLVLATADTEAARYDVEHLAVTRG